MPPKDRQRLGTRGSALLPAVALLTLGLLAAACSTGETATSDGTSLPKTSKAAETSTTSDPEPVVTATIEEPSGVDSASEAVPEDATESTETEFLAVSNPQDYPAETIYDLATGDEVAFASMVDGSLPTLLWFWAPH